MKGRTGKLGPTVSALSRHIAKLKGDLGVSLFERHARGMFYRTLTIACTEGFAFDFLPVSLAAFCAKHADVAIRLEVVQSDRASQMLLSGEASIALAFSFKPEAGVVVQFTQRAPVMASTHLEHPLAQRSKIALEELSAYPVLLQDKGTTNRQLFDIACNVESI